MGHPSLQHVRRPNDNVFLRFTAPTFAMLRSFSLVTTSAEGMTNTPSGYPHRKRGSSPSRGVERALKMDKHPGIRVGCPITAPVLAQTGVRAHNITALACAFYCSDGYRGLEVARNRPAALSGTGSPCRSGRLLVGIWYWKSGRRPGQLVDTRSHNEERDDGRSGR